jgi:hypothetical protein
MRGSAPRIPAPGTMPGARLDERVWGAAGGGTDPLVWLGAGAHLLGTMAFRLQLTPEAVRVLSTCEARVRERVLHELGSLFAGPLLGMDSQFPGETAPGACSLPSGFRVRYALDRVHGLLHLLELRAPEGEEAPVSS